ncbi:hypothetical protein NBRC10512_005788 [Rhodotorula toruloides]|uniref:RHTO0S21e01618g1_1 n=2 Tax=Rhodotorula toruloides TaxID=5286 RepID=A0A061BFZ8_RHOTO|nr:zinc finger, MYND-type domain containing protein [Rhodotorula toruloides NP11]EMS18738.1 zinc finger, MYND-type domain containing protein [Rhodotorula toruloides NP11]CDR48918.1 RHTO0S21e01618g1_1 [Rhodotorula toruloides]
MNQQPTGMCMVCGKETQNRCSKCADAGIDLFFCSPEHQKLVWPGHRIFCGSQAFPVSFPLLSKAEVASIVGNLDKTIFCPTIDGQEVQITLMDHIRQAALPGMGVPETLTLILGTSEESTARPVFRNNPGKQQELLLFLRMSTESCIGTTSLRDGILTGLSRLCLCLTDKGIMPYVPEYERNQAELFHRFVVFHTLTAFAMRPNTIAEKMLAMQRYGEALKESEIAMYAFAEGKFGKAFSEKLKEVIQLLKPRGYDFVVKP